MALLHNLGMPQQHPTTLDPSQLARIEAVHRGFLYQHLFAVACLLSASGAGASAIIVEADDDIEVVVPGGRLYAQIKTRSERLTRSDIGSALDRFERLREEHENGLRDGTASFLVVSNVAPGPKLMGEYGSGGWPPDVRLYWPDSTPPPHPLPSAWHNLSEGFAKCGELAATLPFGMLAPETLVWKLSGLVMAASAGTPPRQDHKFQIDELPSLFEQLELQLQDFPAAPVRYRPQEQEPELISQARIRVITGFSGAGKTAWVAQSAQQSVSELAYFDVGDTPGSAIAIPLARELAGRFFESSGGLGQVLLPGATGLEMLRAIDLRLQSRGLLVTVVIDNAHRVPAEGLRSVAQQMPHTHFLLLCQPGATVQELETLFGLASEPLRGWTTDTIAAEAAEAHCPATAASCQKLLDLTGGLPLYVQNSIRIAATDYAGDLGQFCNELERQTHSVTTAQELILSKVYAGFPPHSQDAIAILSMADVPLSRAEVGAFLHRALSFDDAAFARTMRQLRLAGVVEAFGGDRLKVHDAMRVLGRAHLLGLNPEIVQTARLALKDVLLLSITQERNLAKLSLYLRVLADTGDIRSIVQFATDELFHELGLVQEIRPILENAASSETVTPDHRFSALDGLVFGDLKKGDIQSAAEHLALMTRLVEEHSLDEIDRGTLAMKRMSLAALRGDAAEVLREIEQVLALLPDNPEHQRIFRYNAAHALFSLGHYGACVSETAELIPEYYDVLGITPGDVTMKNPDKIFPLLKKDEDHTDDLKHLADCLDLQAQALTRTGKRSGLCRIHAVKFYAMANALDSVVRVGQDLADEFIEHNDYVGARDVLERNVLPNVVAHKMVNRIVPVRSQYAVILAYCGEHAAAANEMASLAPYEGGLAPEGREELRRQRALVAQLRVIAPPQQWEFPPPHRKIGRNEPCYCGSGKKFKRCHGRS
jgi:SEC-C motif